MDDLRINPSIKPAGFPQEISRKQIAGTGGGNENDFRTFLFDSIDEVNKLNQKADTAIQQLASGEAKDIHQVMIAVERASLAFMTMMQVRNKLIQAYQEVMRMRF